MRYLGKVSDISKRGRLLLRAELTPDLGARVLDDRMSEVGVITRVFGPVSGPYVAIEPNKDTGLTLKMIGKQLYIKE